MNTFIYSIDNKETGEIYYIGSCTRKYFSQRRGDHTKIKPVGSYLDNKKVSPIHYKISEAGGWDKFEFHILYECDAMERLERVKLEQEYIESLKPLYNIIKAYETKDEYLERKRIDGFEFRQRHPR